MTDEEIISAMRQLSIEGRLADHLTDLDPAMKWHWVSAVDRVGGVYADADINAACAHLDAAPNGDADLPLSVDQIGLLTSDQRSHYWHALVRADRRNRRALAAEGRALPHPDDVEIPADVRKLTMSNEHPSEAVIRRARSAVVGFISEVLDGDEEGRDVILRQTMGSGEHQELTPETYVFALNVMAELLIESLGQEPVDPKAWLDERTRLYAEPEGNA